MAGPPAPFERRQTELVGLTAFLIVAFAVGMVLLSFPDAFRVERAFPATVNVVRVCLVLLTGIFVVHLVDAARRLRAQQAAAIERERQATDHLRLLNEIKDTMLTAVSHELRTPLTSVIGYAQTLRLKADRLGADQQRQFLDKLHDNALRLEKLLNDLMDVDRLDRGGVITRRKVADLADLSIRVADAMEVPRELLTRSLAPAPALVDVPQTERIIDNLLTNAFRHTPPGTRVWIRTFTRGGESIVAVEDAGGGVPQELGAEIFRPFRQGPIRRVHSPGLGIGLSLVSRLVRLQGGRVWVQDREGGGASFQVAFPTAAVGAEQEQLGVR